jgi:hypothetical protein
VQQLCCVSRSCTLSAAAALCCAALCCAALCYKNPTCNVCLGLPSCLSCLNPLGWPHAPAVDETLRLLKAFQFTDKHGEVRRQTPACLRSCLPACLPHVDVPLYDIASNYSITICVAAALRWFNTLPLDAGVPRQLAGGRCHHQAQPQGEPGEPRDAEGFPLHRRQQEAGITDKAMLWCVLAEKLECSSFPARFLLRHSC